MTMKRLILCDFDGTISLRDMGYVLLNRFSSGDWEAIDRDFCEGKIGSKEAYLRIAKIIKGDEESVLHFVEPIQTSIPYFVSFYHYCRERQGIDAEDCQRWPRLLHQDPLELHHLSEIPFYANCTRFRSGDGMELSFPFASEECGLCRTPKKSSFNPPK